jgi:glycerol-3-phosphate dehydrogenase (NAD(P)+)
MKGIELGTAKRMSEVIAHVTGAGPERVGVLSGPNLAREIAQRQPSASVVAAADEGLVHEVVAEDGRAAFVDGGDFLPEAGLDGPAG